MGKAERQQKRLAAGWQALDRGDQRAAEEIARAELSKHPRDSGSLELLGASLFRQSRFREAIAPLRQAFGEKPPKGAGYQLGYCYLAAGDPGSAVPILEQEVNRFPDLVESRNLLGISLFRQRRHEEALSVFAAAIEKNPHDAATYSNMGNALADLGRNDEAGSCFRKAIELLPGDPVAHYNLGRVHQAQKRYGAAIECYSEALRIAPADWESHNGLGVALAGANRRDEAVACYRKALALNPGFAAAHCNLGVALSASSLDGEAIEHFRKALAIQAEFPEALTNLGIVLRKQGRAEEAIECHRKALSLKPGYATALLNLGTVYADTNRIAEAIACFEGAMSASPDHNYVLSALVWAELLVCRWNALDAHMASLRKLVVGPGPVNDPFTLVVASNDASAQRLCAERFAKLHARDNPMPERSSLLRHAKIRVAYLSGDFHDHATASLMAGLFESHDRSRFETIAVSYGLDDRSGMRNRLAGSFDRFVDARSMGDAEAATLVRELEVDIAVDLKGYTKDSRPGILAYRAAPIQVNYLGYPGTMGAGFIDYILADRFVLPPEQQPFYAEKVIYLPDSYQVNDSKRPIDERTSSRAEAGLPQEGFVFCCFNNNYKIQPPVFDVWMRLLRAMPGSVLWLLRDNALAEENLCKEARARGIDPARLVFAPRIKLEEHLARHRLADLFLDTLPCNAHTTASDALWSGLPVLSCAGATFAGRVAGSLLHAVGLPELVTTSLEEYEALGLRLATDPALLGDLRQRLARNRMTAPLFDTDRFRRHIESAYTTMWEICQRGEPPRAFAVDPIE